MRFRRLPVILLLLSIGTTAVAEDEPDPFSGWDRRFVKAGEFAADSYTKLAKWAERSGLPRSASRARRRVLLLAPDHEKTRALLGYERKKEGGWVWPEAKRQAIRELTDDNEEKAGDFPRRLRLADRRVADRFRTLGKTAEFRIESEPARMEAWNDRLFRAFEKVLTVYPDDQAAREILGHPEFEGRRVDPKAYPFLKMRKIRRDAGRAAARLEFEILEMGRDRALSKVGVTAAVARSRHFTLATTWGPERAGQLALAAERALAELLRVNRFPFEIADRNTLKTIYILKDKPELREFLKNLTDWDDDRITRQLKRFTNAYFRPGAVAEHIEAEPRMIDGVMNYACRTTVRAARRYFVEELEEGADPPKLEAWLRETLVSDVLKRLTGDSLTTFSEVPRYAHERRDTKGQDRWMTLARERVESDDDVPLARLPHHRLIDLDGAAAVKGYAFLQYLFERSPERARAFVKAALVHGSAPAAKAVYKRTLAELDAGYRAWVLLTW
jgi:hypothetical protein